MVGCLLANGLLYAQGHAFFAPAVWHFDGLSKGQEIFDQLGYFCIGKISLSKFSWLFLASHVVFPEGRRHTNNWAWIFYNLSQE